MDWLISGSLVHFHFLRPYWLASYIVVWGIFRILTRRDDSLAPWQGVMSATILQHLTVAGNTQRWFSPMRLSKVIACLLPLVLAGPTWQQQPSPFTEDQAVLVIALDVSQTMDQTDTQPSRLIRAKQKILELLAQRGDAYTALVAYSGSAHVVMPLSKDNAMIRHFLDALDHSIMPVSGKRTEALLPILTPLLANTAVPGTVMLLTDGVKPDAQTALAEFFAVQSHQLLVWGFGESQAPAGSDIIAMQQAQLESLSRAANGRFIKMSHDKSDVEAMGRYIKHNLVVVEDESRPWVDAGYPLVWLIAVLFLVWFRKGWTLQW